MEGVLKSQGLLHSSIVEVFVSQQAILETVCLETMFLISHPY